ncbi:MAG: tRNA (guanosine(37)-N1)-methyltransferase TrmD, partial [Lachnospiraceae bacterium]|nr:tRNA (guanosine(37)-N1)-methyltransferase TrmD [Lachnospiraceae bacterium]
QYTKPAEYNGVRVPDVLLSGHHENIRKWRLEQSLRLTRDIRPDLLEKHHFTEEEKRILRKIEEETNGLQ